MGCATNFFFLLDKTFMCRFFARNFCEFSVLFQISTVWMCLRWFHAAMQFTRSYTTRSFNKIRLSFITHLVHFTIIFSSRYFWPFLKHSFIFRFWKIPSFMKNEQKKKPFFLTKKGILFPIIAKTVGIFSSVIFWCRNECMNKHQCITKIIVAIKIEREHFLMH